jgi:hypothetical protein
LDKKFDTVSIRNKIKMSFEDSDEESNDKPPYVNYYDIIIYDPSLVKVSYIAKVQIP